MSRRILLLTLALVASAVICAAATGARVPTVWSAARVAQGPFGTALLRSLNHMRARHRLPRLAADARMNREASRYSQAMARHGFFSHGAWVSRVGRAAGRPRDIGEVLGWLEAADPNGEAAWVVRMWLRSPEHRRVLLDGSFSRVGIGRAVGGGQESIYTVDFASAR